jgi:hypothetical protein
MSFLNKKEEMLDWSLMARWERLTYLARGSWEVIRRGRGMDSIIKSEEIFSTAFVIKWWIAAEH